MIAPVGSIHIGFVFVFVLCLVSKCTTAAVLCLSCLLKHTEATTEDSLWWFFFCG